MTKNDNKFYVDIDFLDSLIDWFEDLNYKEQKPSKEEIIERMDKWRKEYDGKFSCARVFWEMFFKELEKLL